MPTWQLRLRNRSLTSCRLPLPAQCKGGDDCTACDPATLQCTVCSWGNGLDAQKQCKMRWEAQQHLQQQRQQEQQQEGLALWLPLSHAHAPPLVAGRKCAAGVDRYGFPKCDDCVQDYRWVEGFTRSV